MVRLVPNMLKTRTDHLEVLLHDTLRVRAQENVKIQDSSKSYPGESRGRLQYHL